jgi:hypothetical protein
MSLLSWLADVPIVVIGAGAFIAVMLAALLGRLIRERRGKAEKDDADGLMVSSALGLLALLLGFTFALATDRFEIRRVLVLQEANAIGTLYLQSHLLEEPHRARMTRTLYDYTKNRIALAQAEPEATAMLLTRNDRLVDEIWSGAEAAFPTIKTLDFSSTYISNVNAVIDLDQSRKSARLARVPGAVLDLLLLYVIIAGAIIGFAGGHKPTFGLAALVLAMQTLLLMLIIDIDRPTAGAVNESQAPMERTFKTMTPN